MARRVTMADATAVAANSSSLNAFRDSAYVRAPFNGFISIYATGSATGREGQLMVAGQLVIERQGLNTNNRVPIVPEDIIVSDVPVLEGQLIQWSVFNTTAGSLTPRTRVEIEEG